MIKLTKKQIKNINEIVKARRDTYKDEDGYDDEWNVGYDIGNVQGIMDVLEILGLKLKNTLSSSFIDSKQRKLI